MYTVTIESYAEFAERHGGEQVNVKGWLVFPDGARCSASDGNVQYEPPTNPSELLQLQRDYWRARLRAEEDAFDQFRSDSSQQALYAAKYPNLPVPVDAPRQLQEGRQRIDALRQRLAEVEEQLAATPQAVQQRERAAREDRERNDRAQVLREINSVSM